MAFEGMTKKLPLPAKNIRVYRNGDEFFPGKKFVINSREIKDMDTLYTYLTDTVKPRFGCVRNIYTPEGGTKIENLKDLVSNRAYVISGFEKFKYLHGGSKYTEIGKVKPKSVKKTYSHIRPVAHGRFQAIRGRWQQVADEINHPVQLWLHVNGDSNSLPVKFLLPHRILKLEWPVILEYITERIGMRLGCAVRKLYTVDKELVNGVKDLTSGKTYIACGYERLKQRSRYMSGGLFDSGETPRKELKRKPLPPIKPKNRVKSSYGNQPAKDMQNTKDEFDEMVQKMQNSKKAKAPAGNTKEEQMMSDQKHKIAAENEKFSSGGNSKKKPGAGKKAGAKEIDEDMGFGWFQL